MVAVALTSGVVVATTLAQAANGPIMSAARPGEAAARLQIQNQATTADQQLARLLADQINTERTPRDSPRTSSTSRSPPSPPPTPPIRPPIT